MILSRRRVALFDAVRSRARRAFAQAGPELSFGDAVEAALPTASSLLNATGASRTLVDHRAATRSSGGWLFVAGDGASDCVCLVEARAIIGEYDTKK